MNLDPLFDRLRRSGTGWIALRADAVPFHAELTGPERLRADRFRAEADRTAFVAGRMLIRAALSAWTGVESVPLEIDERGKPFCPLQGAPSFNLSHAGGWVALALSTTCAVGIDLEDLNRRVDRSKLAARYFTAAEQAAVADGPPEMFFEIWTRKEARLKATGQGIRVPLNQVDTLSCGDMTFEHFKPDPSLLGCVAVWKDKG
ncbi:MAG: 4'-phosphopantetheinyl transferase superfamily protein [Verrucomicrobia bacterium]|nr:4'-phosphopantetheinyl transferase superfamily protein [Verrucomicrobiota bacterium]MCH8527081.1 4'-phosphopantetheinyl transferase superfamily protein [Kiritimatiellia bacterium]